MDLIDAVKKDISYIVYMLMEDGSDPNFTEDWALVTPLHYAVIYNSLQSIPILITAGADPYAVDAFGNTPLDEARELGRDEIENLIIKCSEMEKVNH